MAFRLFLLLLLGAVSQGASVTPIELATHQPATCSSIENDEHDASHANDGDPKTCWCADDEPESGPDWWQVDLGKSFDLSSCEITWPYDGMKYLYKVEGSPDQHHWTLLSDKTKSATRQKVQRLDLTNGRGIRFVKITIIGFDDGCSASISEVKVFGVGTSHS